MNLYKSSKEIRNLFLKFFKNNNHYIVKGSSLIPKEDNSILFTNSGMNQFKNILLGLENPKYKNVATIQKCIRAGGKHNDLDQIGYTSKHHTFFEMLGNFSFGGYFKLESIELALKLITDNNWFSISKKNILITVNNMDEESYKLWIKMGIKKNQIIKIGSNKDITLSDNFWKMNDNGPCGPSSEIFYCENIDKINNIISLKNFLDIDCIEIWNLVFMQFNQINNKKLLDLPLKSIDTGMGLERISSILQNVKSNYNIDIFDNIIKYLYKFFDNFKINDISIKIISDHIRSIIFIINEEITPSNEGRGYILRKIIRRADYHGIIIGINKPFLYKMVENVVNLMDFYKLEIYKNIDKIKKIIFLEEFKFINVINSGIKILEKEILKFNNKFISGKFIFKLHDTYGLPIYLINDFLIKKNVKYDIKEFNNLMNIQKNKSRINKKFK